MAEGVLDFLFNGQPPPNATSATVSQQGFPDWYQDYLRGLASKSSAIAAAPFQGFQGPRVADQTDMQRRAFDMTNQNVGAYTPAVQGALSTLGGIAGGSPVGQMHTMGNAATPWTGGENDPDMTGGNRPGLSSINPSNGPQTDDLMSSIARLGTRNLTENLMPAVNNTFIGAGQFGSSRMEDFYGRATRDTQEAVTNAQAQALLQNQQQRMQAAQGMGTMAQLGQTMNLRDSAALDTAGQEQQAFGQANINSAMDSFNEERQYPYQQASFMNSILRGMQVPQVGASQTTAPFQGNMNPSGLSTLAGSALTASALQNLFKARGGLVHLAEGGPAKLEDYKGKHIFYDRAGNITSYQDEMGTLRPGYALTIPHPWYNPTPEQIAGSRSHERRPRGATRSQERMDHDSPDFARGGALSSLPTAKKTELPRNPRFQRALLPRPRAGALGYLRQPRV